MAPPGFTPLPFPYDLGAAYTQPKSFYDVQRQTRDDARAMQEAYINQAYKQMLIDQQMQNQQQEQADRDAISQIFQQQQYDPATADAAIAGALLKRGSVDPYMKLRPKLPTTLGEADRTVIGDFSGVNIPQGATQEGLRLGIAGQSSARRYPSAEPLDPQTQQFWADKFGVSPEQIRNRQDVRNLLSAQGQNRLNQVNQRQAETFELKKSQLELPNYEPIDPKIRLSEPEKNRFSKQLQDSAELQAQLAQLGSDIAQSGGWQVFGNDSAKINAYASMIFNTYRKYTGSGARLEGPEGEFIKSMTPAAASSDPIRAIKNWMFQRDPTQLSRDMIELARLSDDAAASSYGLKKRQPFGQALQTQPTPELETSVTSVPQSQYGTFSGKYNRDGKPVFLSSDGRPFIDE